MITITVCANSYFKDAEAASTVSTWVKFYTKNPAELPMWSLSAPPSACFSDGMCFSLVSDGPVEYVPFQAFSVAIDAVLLLDMGVHSLG